MIAAPITETTMTKLSDTQALILSAAAQRADAIALPLPESLRGGAAAKVVGAMLTKGFREEVTDRRKADAARTRLARDRRRPRRHAGRHRRRPRRHRHRARGVPYAFNEGTNSAGETAAGAPTGADGRRTRRQRSSGRPTRPRPRPQTRPPRKPREGTKQATLIAMLRAPDGATIEEIMAATGWQSHTVRGAMAGALKKKLGLEVTSEKVERSGRVYKLPAA